jgi:hypothetical protein
VAPVEVTQAQRRRTMKERDSRLSGAVHPEFGAKTEKNFELCAF